VDLGIFPLVLVPDGLDEVMVGKFSMDYCVVSYVILSFDGWLHMTVIPKVPLPQPAYNK
jgi:hypothetical protein